MRWHHFLISFISHSLLSHCVRYVIISLKSSVRYLNTFGIEYLRIYLTPLSHFDTFVNSIPDVRILRFDLYYWKYKVPCTVSMIMKCLFIWYLTIDCMNKSLHWPSARDREIKPGDLYRSTLSVLSFVFPFLNLTFRYIVFSKPFTLLLLSIIGCIG